MGRVRIIPVLLLDRGGLYKTVRFDKPSYVGDPINTVKIFNDKEADELVVLDYRATIEQRRPDFEKITEIAGEAFMPMAYGGGIRTLEHVQKVFALGFEKVIIHAAAYESAQLVRDAVAIYGSQSIVGCLDVRRTLLGRYELCTGHQGYRSWPRGMGTGPGASWCRRDHVAFDPSGWDLGGL